MTRASSPPLRDPFEEGLRAARPFGAGELEQRLAIASILSRAASGNDEPVRLGRLELQSRIGGGGMGSVYRAFDPTLRRLVAVKLLKRSADDDTLHARIADEARALAQLNHPNVVAVYDIVQERDGLYFTMEYVAGMTLRAWLVSHPEAHLFEVLEWFIQAGRGLIAAHEAGLVHRDVKPDNILIGQDGRVRIADFGLARAPGHARGAEQAGTPYYMAPEVQAGAAATPASDQYGFCLSLRDAIAGRQPPPALAQVVARGIEPAPRDRHANLAFVVRQLERALQPLGDHGPRALLLDRVERLWLRGVLERSLGEGGAVQLRATARCELVVRPWDGWGPGRGSSRTGPGVEPHPEEGKPESVSCRDDLSHLLGEYHGSFLMVGPPGAGKTTSLLLLARDLWRAASSSPRAPAPVVLSLSTYRPRSGKSASAPFADWVVDELVFKYGLPRPAVRRWLEEANVVLLLDGLDETDPAFRQRVVEGLNAFRREHSVTMVVTCRDSEYEALPGRLAFGGAIQLLPLDDPSMTELLEGRHAARAIHRLASDPALKAQLRNPLLLSLYASAYGDGEVASSTELADAYARHVALAFEPIAVEERRELWAGLTYLARQMKSQNVSDLWLERLHFGWLSQAWEQRAGYLVGVLVVVAFGVGLNLAQVLVTNAPVGSAAIFGVGVTLSSFAYTRGRITPIESLRWSWRRALRLLPLTTVCALVIGLLEALQVNFWSNMAGAAITGAILALLFALEPGERATQVRPNAGVRQSLTNALMISFGFGVPVGLSFYHVFQPYVTHPLATVPEYRGEPQLVVGVSVGLFAFTALFLIYGGFTVIMHAVLRLWLAWRTPLPLNLQRMLDRAVEVGLMRRVGGGYLFLHRTLLGYFADEPGKRW